MVRPRTPYPDPPPPPARRERRSVVEIANDILKWNETPDPGCSLLVWCECPTCMIDKLANELKDSSRYEPTPRINR